MRAAQAGDSAAYLALLREVTPRIRRVVSRRRAPSAIADVEDLVQDILLSVHVARASYDPNRPFLPWLIAIVRNRLADGARRQARVSAHEVQVEDLEVTFGELPTNSPTESIGDARALRDAIHALPVGQRAAIDLLKMRELSLKEAAALTGSSVGALKVATHRAMTALRRMLTARETDGH